jgi:hypothetical protein
VANQYCFVDLPFSDFRQLAEMALRLHNVLSRCGLRQIRRNFVNATEQTPLNSVPSHVTGQLVLALAQIDDVPE